MRSFTWIWAALTLVSGTEYGSPRCQIYEFECRGGSKCISGELYCDGRDQCGDRSDEPLGCTPCNRTYYGEVGRSYRLSIPRPRSNKLPFICDLHFVAKHEEYGDLIQLTLEEFKLGRFMDSHTSGCPDGYLKLLDGFTPRDLPRLTDKGESGGQFCGIVSKSIRPVYISEKNELTAALRFFKFYNGETPERSFAVRLKYKFLRLSRAHSRFGDFHEESPRRGGLCHINFTDCSRRTCHLRSPNYPGIYPRNATCNYRIVISPNEVPKGKAAFISVSQPSHFKTHILSAPKKKGGSGGLSDGLGGVKESGYLFFGGRRREEEGSLGLFEECKDDTVTIYDGIYNTDPVLISFCRGDVIPPIVSSSDSGMLVVFKSSPFGVPDMEPFTLNGFDLRVNVIFKNQASILAAPIKEECRFTIRSGVNPPFGVHEGSLSSGVIENVIHRLVSAKNRSCYYEFQGNSDEVLWITFLKFKVAYDKKKNHRQHSRECIHRISLQDHEDHTTLLSPSNQSLSETFCESRPPNICDHDYLQFNHHTKKFRFRNCWRHWNESYVSRSSKFTLIEFLSSLHSGSVLNFKFRYEFVNVGQGGSAIKRERKVHFINENRNREPVIHRSPILHRDSSLSKPAQKTWVYSDRHSRITHSNNMRLSKAQMNKKYRAESFPTCHRVFTSNVSSRKRKKRFFSTKNVFFFGRGSGQKDLQCSYTFQGRPGERILLRIKRLNLFNQETCRTIPDPYGAVDHFICQRNSTQGTISEIQISEIPDQKGISLCQFCLCGTGQGNFLSNTSTLRLDLIISGMTPFTDYSQFLIEGSYEFIHEPVCRLTKIISGQPSGVIEFNDRPDCERQPWVLKPLVQTHFLYLRIPGYVMLEPDACSHTHNRLIIHRSSMESLIICPSKLHFLEIFSTGWENEHYNVEESSKESGASSVVIESSVVDRDQIQDIHIRWLEVWKPLSLLVDPERNSALKIESLTAAKKKKPPVDEEEHPGLCDEFCPEINGCISPLLWCDGEAHCPSSGADESEEHCSHVLLPSIYYYGLSSLLGIVLFVFSILIIYKVHIWVVHTRKDPNITVVSSAGGSSRVRRRPTYLDDTSLTNISGTIETTVFSGHHQPFIVEGGTLEDGYS